MRVDDELGDRKTDTVGCWERPDATAAAFKDGWVRTGDMYVRGVDV